MSVKHLILLIKDKPPLTVSQQTNSNTVHVDQNTDFIYLTGSHVHIALGMQTSEVVR